ncbi:hypothetical protein E2P86_09005 [Sphingobacterium psychroaquaticum]|uniref:hypothetical protein n=1 Tax=Sphingobacterium psychroaquaticum TaxID=561061 RepID=UPI00106C09CB|nr:hypothetical protein [Sphingobacterium psychroaquaticum]QBQ41287.1 hypothetical protein E2P86_09005 [Sphingobacterium psychroaquaticum]
MGYRKLLLDVPADFLILCEVTGFSPEHAIQYFIDHVSYPKLLSLYPVDPYGAVTALVYGYGKRRVRKVDRDFGSSLQCCAFDLDFKRLRGAGGKKVAAELEVLARMRLKEYLIDYLSAVRASRE